MRTFIFYIHRVEKNEDSNKNRSFAKVCELINVDGIIETKQIGFASFPSSGIGGLSEVKNYLVFKKILDPKYKVKPYHQYSLDRADEFGVRILQI